jgi:hypothetical protein
LKESEVLCLDGALVSHCSEDEDEELDVESDEEEDEELEELEEEDELLELSATWMAALISSSTSATSSSLILSLRFRRRELKIPFSIRLSTSPLIFSDRSFLAWAAREPRISAEKQIKRAKRIE